MEKKTRADFTKLICDELISRGLSDVEVTLLGSIPEPQITAVTSKWKSPPVKVPQREVDGILRQLLTQFELQG
jgi:hypothetical protein